MSMIGVGLLCFVNLIRHVCQAQTPSKLTILVVATGAAAAKAILSWLYPLSQQIGGDEPEIRRQDGVIDIIHHRHWELLAPWERAELAPMTTFFILGRNLGWEEMQLLDGARIRYMLIIILLRRFSF